MTTEKSSFNKTHPELREGEVFLENIVFPKDEQRIPEICLGQVDYRSDWETTGWKTKRMGKIAYTRSGDPLLAESRPVFVQQQELVDAGINPDTLRSN